MIIYAIRKSAFIIVCLLLVYGCAAANKPTPELIQDLGNPDREIRLSAAWVLGQRGEQAVPALINALNDPDKGVQYACTWSLANIGTSEAKDGLKQILPLLEQDLNDEDIEISKTAADLLIAIDTPDAHEILKKHGIDQ